MAELHTYKCQKCGWETSASPGGGDLLMVIVLNVVVRWKI